MSWRLAKSLSVLLAEANAAAPDRSKTHDGTIGDAAHASRASRHNPNSQGVVCALDITHDPAHGMDVHALARRLALHPHPDLAYIVSNREIATKASGFRWRKYYGASAHEKHAHFAVGVGPDSNPQPPYDTLVAWGVREEEEEDDMFTDADRILLKQLRVTAVAQSFDMPITEALHNDDMVELENQKAKKKKAIEDERKRLGLS